MVGRKGDMDSLIWNDTAGDTNRRRDANNSWLLDSHYKERDSRASSPWRLEPLGVT